MMHGRDTPDTRSTILVQNTIISKLISIMNGKNTVIYSEGLRGIQAHDRKRFSYSVVSIVQLHHSLHIL